MSTLTFGLLCFSSLFTVIDPLGVAPIFASLTRDVEGKARRRVVLRACVAALAALVLFAAAGTYLLRLFGVTVEAFRIGGGILFGLLGLSMLGVVGASSHGPEPGADRQDPSVVPLGIPLIGGPGAITTVMVLTGQAETVPHLAAFGTALLAAILVTGLMLAAAPHILHKLGPSGAELVTRLMGLIILVIGVQFVIDGVLASLRPG